VLSGTDLYATAVHLSMDKAGHRCNGPASSSPSDFYRNPGSYSQPYSMLATSPQSRGRSPRIPKTQANFPKRIATAQPHSSTMLKRGRRKRRCASSPGHGGSTAMTFQRRFAAGAVGMTGLHLPRDVQLQRLGEEPAKLQTDDRLDSTATRSFFG
jgi:hypothetical protein